MTSDQTRHIATAGAVPGKPAMWSVTWLPGRTLTRDEAVTAMTIAEMAVERADILADSSSKLWWHMDGWGAVTGSATADQGGWGLAESGPEVARNGPSEGSSATAVRPVPTGRAATPSTMAKPGRTVIPAPRAEHLAAVISDGSATSLGANRSHLSPQFKAAPLGDDEDSSDQSEPASATAGRAGTKPAGPAPVPGAPGATRGPRSDNPQPVSATVVDVGAESAALAYVDGLDGAERKLLLNHIAQAWPEVVEAGVELVARWRAECAERRQERARRMKSERRRRQRADGSR